MTHVLTESIVTTTAGKVQGATRNDIHVFLKSCHALEIPFVFDNIERTDRFTGSSPERFPLAGKMSEAWIAFARDGVPIARELPPWPSYNPEQRLTMIFDTICYVEEDPGGTLREAWSGMPIRSLSE